MKNKLGTRILAFMMIFSIILPIFSVTNYVAGTTAGTEEETTATPEEVKDWLNSMLSRTSGIFIDGTFKSDDYPDSKDGYFIVDSSIPKGYSIVKDGGTDSKPKYALQKDSSGEKYALQLKMEDSFGTRDMSEGLIQVDGKYYIDLNTSMNGGAKDFDGEKVYLSLSKTDGSSSIDSKTVTLPSGQDFDKICDIKTFDETTPWYSVALSWITNPLGQALNLLERILTMLFMALGDGIVLMITNAVGEEVSLDRVIFNMVQKTSINFWEGGRSTTTNTPGDNRLIPIVNDIVIIWYNAFRKIAITAYLIILIYVAIRIILVSTTKEKEKYKDMFKNWVMGIGILFFFPFVMKYSIKINNVLVAEVGKSAIITKGIDPEKAAKIGDDAIGGSGFSELNEPDKEEETKYAPNLMMYINELAKRQGRLSLVFVYFIMIWQLITIIVLYYKRVFMLAFLITIFPLVTMTYTIDKYGDNKAQTFSTWAKEFYVNVFVQLFHAIAYILVVNAGVSVFINNKDWLLLCICVAFLFQGEKILRAIFGIKSAANTIGDLAAAAASVTGMSKIIKDSKLFGNNDKEKLEEVPETTLPREIPTADTNPLLNESYSREENREEIREAENNISENNSANNQIALDIQRIQNEVLNKAITERNNHYNKSKLKKFAKNTFKATGMLVGFASGMAVGKRDAVIKNMAIGRELMGSASSIATGPIRGISNAYTGRKMKKAILNGEMDREFGFDSDTTDETRKATQDAYRKALAKMASAAARKGVDAGKAKFWDTLE